MKCIIKIDTEYWSKRNVDSGLSEILDKETWSSPQKQDLRSAPTSIIFIIKIDIDHADE